MGLYFVLYKCIQNLLRLLIHNLQGVTPGGTIHGMSLCLGMRAFRWNMQWTVSPGVAQVVWAVPHHLWVQLSHVQLFATPWATARQASLFFTSSQRLLKLMSLESVMPSNHLILCGPLLLLPSIFPSIRVLSNESVLCIRWPKYWSFSFSLSNEYSGLISFRIDWFDLFAVQGTRRNLFQKPQFKSINSSVLSFLYNLTLISIHDYWKNHSLSCFLPNLGNTGCYFFKNPFLFSTRTPVDLYYVIVLGSVFL